MFSHNRTLTLLLALGWLSGTATGSAVGDQQRGDIKNDRSVPGCVVTNNLGAPQEIPVPGQLAIPTHVLPVDVNCGSGMLKTLDMSREFWFPVATTIGRKIAVALDPSPRDRNNKPAEVTISFRSVEFDSEEALKNWHASRMAIVNRNYLDRLTVIRDTIIPCKYNAACMDSEDKLESTRATALDALKKIRLLSRKQLATTQEKPRASPMTLSGPVKCTVEKRRGSSRTTAVPARVPVYWREMPLSVTCNTPDRRGIEHSVRMPRDRWLPITLELNDNVIAHLDPKTGYRFRKPAQMTLSLYAKGFKTAADRDRWHNERISRIEKAHEARQKAIENSGIDCKFDAACLDELENLAEITKTWRQNLERLKASTFVLPPGTAYRKPARVEIDDGNGKTCLTKIADGTWKSRPCIDSDPVIRRIVVDGKEECIARVDATTWESRPCP